MAGLAGIGFASPWLLLGLVALPVLWVLLRAVPPAPVRRMFPGLALLLGLRDDDAVADRTPWWLLALRMLALAALILGFAGPVMNPDRDAAPGSGPLLVLLDGTWADAPDWPARLARAKAEAGTRPVAVGLASQPPEQLEFQPAAQAALEIDAQRPNPWGIQAWTPPDGRYDTLWISDGVDWPARADLLRAVQARGAVRVIEPKTPVAVITGVVADDGITVQIAATGSAPATVQAIGTDPNGVTRVLDETAIAENAGSFDLPIELRNRVDRFVLSGAQTAGAVWLAGSDLRRRKVGLLSAGRSAEQVELLSPLHYLRQAYAPSADVIEGTLLDLVDAKPDVLVLADVSDLAGVEVERLVAWAEEGGVLIRFAGPFLAQSEGDALLPVRLRSGGRTLGGAMSWDRPRHLAPFPVTSPFAGLDIPADVEIGAQVLAEPGPDLEGRVLARLEDGTPLVTANPVGQGQIVLFHVTANADWSNLPLSGLFPQMLERLAKGAGAAPDQSAIAPDSLWQLEQAMDVRGSLSPMSGETVAGDQLGAAVGPDVPPGLYRSADRRIAVNAGAGLDLRVAQWPGDVPVDHGETAPPRAFGGWLIAAGLALLAADIIGALAVAGRLAVLLAAPLLFAPPPASAQAAPGDDAFAIEATASVVFAHVLTGNAQVDDLAQAGLYGLGNVLFRRTAIEPGQPIGVDIETDELSFFPMLYWPIDAETPLPSGAAVLKLNRYLRGGGMILFDTRDGDMAGLSNVTPAAQRLRVIASALDVPPLEPVPSDHVLTRSFYLLDSFPGRYDRGQLWVEAAPPTELEDGMPFRDLNDGVSPIVITSGDFIAAWATDAAGNRLLPVGRGAAGERQREMAYRVGVNLAMYVLTGNYKSDQVHVPALLDRLESR